MTPIKQKSFIFIALALIISGLIAYFGYRTIKHEALLRHYQTTQLAKNQAEAIKTQLHNLLAQRATHLDAAARYLPLSPEALNSLLAQEVGLEAVFVFKQNRLIYPTEAQITQLAIAKWVDQMRPIINDPSLLYGHSIRSELEIPKSGWLIRKVDETTELIYWLKKGDAWIGFKYVYVLFLADVINSFDDGDFSAGFIIKEDDRVLVNKAHQNTSVRHQELVSLTLDYPLHGWQIDVSLAQSDMAALYWAGMAIIIALILSVCGFLLYIYREYQRTVHIALQQVNFVGQVSHELKTPLTNILLYTELLKEELDDERPELDHALEVIAGEGRRLSRLIHNVLSFTRMPERHNTTFEINQLSSQIHSLFVPVFAARGMTLTLQQTSSCSLTSDADRITQILSNFLSNAEKYAVNGGRVDLIVAFHKHTQQVALSVRDYGPGISESQIKQVFKPFYRLTSAVTEGVAGTGIGLTIARQLAHSLEGEINACNTHPGICFTLLVPLTPRNFSGVVKEN